MWTRDDCCVCGKGMVEGKTLFRVNALGEEGIWVCREDRSNVPALPIPKEQQELIDIIDGTKR